MNILHINSYYASSKFYKNLYDIQIKDDNIVVYVPVANSYKIDRGFGNYSIISHCYNKIDRLLFHKKHGKILKDIETRLDISSFDIIHAHSLFSNGYIAYKLSKKYNIPFVVAVRNTDVNVFFKYMFHLRFLGINILKSAKKIIFISYPYKELTINKFVPNKLKNDFNEKSIVVPNGVSDFWINNIYSVERTLGDTINFVYVGDINKNKNVLMSAKALNELIKSGIKLNFNVAGKIKDKRIFNKLSKFTFFNYHGVLNESQLLELYRSNDIFIMPSKKETFGIVYLEAMSQGLPVIYSKGQGFDGYQPDGEIGYRVLSNDINDIVQILKNVINNYSEISSNSTKTVKNYIWFELNKIYNSQYRKLY
jgi:glycosyltransferase involved in cell wall biosynthesis